MSGVWRKRYPAWRRAVLALPKNGTRAGTIAIIMVIIMVIIIIIVIAILVSYYKVRDPAYHAYTFRYVGITLYKVTLWRPEEDDRGPPSGLYI